MSNKENKGSIFEKPLLSKSRSRRRGFFCRAGLRTPLRSRCAPCRCNMTVIATRYRGNRLWCLRAVCLLRAECPQRLRRYTADIRRLPPPRFAPARARSCQVRQNEPPSDGGNAYDVQRTFFQGCRACPCI